MKHAKAVLKSARVVAALAEVYWDRRCFVDRRTFIRAESNWLEALVHFVSGYAYERYRAPTSYRSISRKALTQTGAGLVRPTDRFAGRAWKRFTELAKEQGVGTNKRVDPLAPGRGFVPATEFVLRLGDDRHNILRWAKSQIAASKARDAVSELRSIRGIGPKLAAFYLRDVAWAYDLMRHCEDLPCLQAVDVWVSRAVEAWSGDEQTTSDAARFMVSLATEAGVSPLDLNAGAWIAGSQLELGRDMFISTLRDVRALRKRIEENVAWYQGFATWGRAAVDA